MLERFLGRKRDTLEELERLRDECLREHHGYITRECLGRKIRETGFCRKYPEFCRSRRLDEW